MIYRPRQRFRKKEIARINERIFAKEVRLISSEGEQLGIKPTREAIEMAKEEGLDLVEVASKAKPPVARVMDYGKYKYEQEQKAKLAKKKQHIIEVKEIKFRPKISGGDYETKKKHIEKFLQSGFKVKATIMFRGREMAYPELGRRILEKLIEDTAQYSNVEAPPKRDGRNMVMVLSSTVKPKSVKESKLKNLQPKEEKKKEKGWEAKDAEEKNA